MANGAQRPKPKYRTLPLKQLFIDDRYQRELSQRRVRKTADEFDPAKLGVLEVSQRGKDKYAVFDGQHRLAVLEIVGYTEAPCLVHEGLSPQKEAALFVAIQNERKRPQAIEEFVARVFAGDPQAVAINNILKKQGLRIKIAGGKGDTASIGTIGAVTACERVFLAGNLEAVLDIIVAVWKDERKAFDANMIEAMSLFLALYGPKVNEDKLLDTLYEESPISLIRKASAKRYTTGGAIRDLLVEELRALVSGGQGGVILRRPPVFERQVAVRHLKAIKRAFEMAQAANGKATVRLTQSEITEIANLTSANAGSALRTLLAVGQLRQSGKKKLPNLPESPAYVMVPETKNAAPS